MANVIDPFDPSTYSARLATFNNTIPEEKENEILNPFNPSVYEGEGIPTFNYDVEEKLKLDDLYRPENMEIMRNYIIDVSGKQAERYTDDQVHEMFLTRMRDFETSDVGILDEGYYITKANDKQRANAGKAYMLYDNLSSVFTSGSTLDAIFGVAEHLKNIFNPFESPTTYAGVGIGKIVTAVGGKTASQVIKAKAKKLAKEELAKSGKFKQLKESGKQNLKRQALSGVLPTYVKQSMKDATKNYAMKQALVATGVDMFTAGALDWHYQNTKVKANAQDKVSGIQVGLSSLMGLVGGSVEWYRISKGTNKTTASYNKDFVRDWRTKNAQTPVDREALDNRIATDMETWAEKTFKGGKILQKLRGQTDAPSMVGNSITNQFWEAVLVGDSNKGVSGIARIMQEEGFLARLTPDQLDPTTGKLKGFTDKFTSLFIESAENGGMSQKAKDRITKALTDVGVFDEIKRDPSVRDLGIRVNTIEDLARLFARDARSGGQVLNLASRLSKVAKGDANYLRAVADEQDAVKAIEGTTTFSKYLNAFKNNAMWMQNVWRRTVVSALQTSVLNVKGFKAATAINAFADISLIPVEYANSLFKFAKGDREGALRSLQRTKDIRENQIERLRNFLDPNATKEMFEDLMRIDKRSARILDKAIAGGLEGAKDVEEIAKKFDLDPKNPFFRAVEGYTNVAQKIMLVDTVDKFMKSQAYLGNLDMAIRENISGMNFRKMSQLSQKELNKLLVSEEFIDATIQATNLTMSDIFSKSYRYVGKEGGNKYLTQIAGFIEEFGNIPILGTAFPFGKFFNNTVALTYDVMGGGNIAAIMELAKTGAVSYGTKRRAAKGLIGGGGFGLMFTDPLGLSTTDKDGQEKESTFPIYEGSRNLFEDVLKGVMHYTGLNFSLERDREKQRLGLSWNEELKTNGSIVDITYDFPASQYALIARVLNVLKESDQALPKELVGAMSEQLLFGQLQRNLGKYGNIGPIVSEVYNALQTGDFTSLEKVKQLATRGPGSLISGSISGLLRPIDPVNRLSGYYLGTESEVKDAKQTNTLFYDSGRYLHNIFEILMGDSNIPKRREMAREGNIYPTSPASDIFSERTLQPKTYTELALSDVNLKGWAQDLKSYYPEGLSLFNSLIAPVIEKKFEDFVTSKRYKSMPYDKKLRRVKGILSETKAQIKERMITGAYGKENSDAQRARYIMDIADTRGSTRKKALEELNLKGNLTTDEMLELSTLQLYKIFSKIKVIEKRFREERKGRQ